MAFPPRPPNVMQIPGMPPVPSMMPPHYGMPGMPGMIPVTMSMGMMPGPVSIMMGPVMAMPPSIISAPKPHIKKQPQLSTEYLSLQSETSKGPPVTVFVGNITERASDSMIRQMLQRCGTVINWKRVQGANGKLQAFGFCEYGDPESGLRAIRLLHDWEVGDKKLVVKVDAKTKEKLDEYKATKKASHGSGKKAADEDNDLDDMTRDFDMSAKASIQYLLHEHSMELSRPTLEQKAAAANNSDKAKKMTKTQENLMKMSSDLDKDSKNNLDEMDLEDDKRNLIHREIDKFRDTYKRAEEEKEKEKERREKERQTKGDRSTPEAGGKEKKDVGKTPDRPSPDRDRERKRERDRERDREREREQRERERTRDQERDRDRERNIREYRDSRDGRMQEDRYMPRSRSPSREKEANEWNRERDMNNDMNRGRDRDYERERDNRGERDIRVERDSRGDRENNRGDRENSRGDRENNRGDRENRGGERENRGERERDREEDEELYEKKKLERKLREKEAAYKERLRNWEAREKRRNKEYEKEAVKETEKRHEEVTSLKEARRLKEFLEDYDDERDDPKYYKGNSLIRRLKEREKEMESDNRDAQKEKEELEELRKKLAEKGHPDPEAEASRIYQEEEARLSQPLPPAPAPKLKTEYREADFEARRKIHLAASSILSPVDSDSSDVKPVNKKTVIEDDSTQNSLMSAFSDVTTPKEEFKPMGFAGLKLAIGQNSNSITAGLKKKRMSLEEVFNTNEDDNADQKKKRKLIPLDELPDEEESKSSGNMSHLSTDEKRKHIKNLIDKIPTAKDELFAYNVDWNLVDQGLMERRIKPWINKKIIEYIGEEEPTLVDFICSKVLIGSSAKSILEDVKMVLDDEAEVFVVKMWRLLIYEIEAKKLGIVKS